MALQEKLRSRTAPYLEPGEEVRQVFMAESGAPPWLFFGILLGLGALVVVWLMRPLIIAVTDRSVVVFRATRFRVATPKELVARLPRQTRLGPVNAKLWAKLDLAGQRVWVHRRFFKEVQAADEPLLAPPSGAPAVPSTGARGVFDPPTSPATAVPSTDPYGVLDAATTSPAPAPAGGAYAGSGSGSGFDAPVPSTLAATGTWPLDAGRGRPWQWTLAGVAGLVTLLLVVGTVAGDNESEARDRLEAYVAGTERHSFVAADGRFRAEFPGPPRRQVQNESVGEIDLETILYQRDVGLDTSFIVTFVDLPGVPPDVTAALNGAANAIAVGLKGEILTSTETDFGGRPAIEFLVESRVEGGTTDVHYGKLRLVVDDRRLYSIGVVGPDNPPDGYDAFLDSFSIVP